MLDTILQTTVVVLILLSFPLFLFFKFLTGRITHLEAQLEDLRKFVFFKLKQRESQQSVQKAPEEKPRAAAVEAVQSEPPIREKPKPSPSPAERRPEPELKKTAAYAPLSEPVETPRESGGVEKGIASRAFIWLGGVALIFAGFFLVKYSIEQGLFTPAMRIISASIFALALGVGAEIFRRKDRDVRIPCALMGAAIAIAYGTVFAANQFYHMIPNIAGLAGLVAVSVFALWVSKKYGWQMGVLALFGAFAAPILISTGSHSVPALLSYLLVMTLGMLVTFYRQEKGLLAMLLLGANIFWGILWYTSLHKDVWIFYVWLLTETLAFAAFGLLARRKSLGGASFQISGPDIARIFAHAVPLLSSAVVLQLCLFGEFRWEDAAGLADCVPFLVFATGFFILSVFEKEMRYTLWLFPAGTAALVYWHFGITPMSYGTAIFGTWMAASLPFTLKSRHSAGFAACLGLSSLLFVTFFWSREMEWWRVAAVFAVGALLQSLCMLNQDSIKKWITFFACIIFLYLSIQCMVYELLWILPAIMAFYVLALLRLDLRHISIPLALFAILSVLGYGTAGGFSYLNWAIFSEKVFWSFLRHIDFPNLTLLTTVFLGACVLLEKKYPKSFTANLIWLLALPAALYAVLFCAGSFLGAGYAQNAAMGCVSMLMALAFLFLSARFNKSFAFWGSALFLILGFLRFTFVALERQNPFFYEIPVAGVTLFNAFAISLLIPGIILLVALKAVPKSDVYTKLARGIFFVCALLLVFGWVNSQVAFAFRGNILTGDASRAEFYAYSVAWIAWAVLLLAVGFIRKNAILRISSLVFSSIAAFKVFLFDTSQLDGLLRALSFALLGFCLIGIGWFYMRFVFKDDEAKKAE